MDPALVLALIVVAVGGLGALLLLSRVFPPAPSSRETGRERPPDGQQRDGARPDLTADFDSGVGHYDPRQSHWNPHASARAARPRPDTTYRPKAEGSTPKWDPYASGQSIRERIREARHRPRRSRPTDDYYTMLGLDHDASDREILRAYRQHASVIHPDKFFDDPERRHVAEEKLKQLNLAMQVLRDPERRALYDGSLGYHTRSSRGPKTSED